VSKSQFLLLAAITVVAIVALQNSSPTIAIAFLGMRTIALPLGVWVVLSVAVGMAIAWVISILFRMAEAAIWHKIRRQSSYRQPPRKVAPAANSRPQEGQFQEEFETAVRRDRSARSAYFSRKPRTEPQTEEEEFLEEWDDWEEEEEYDRSQEESGNNIGWQDETPARSSYERQQEPTSVSREGSMYSYSYRSEDGEPSEDEDVTDTAIGDRVAEADYRVVVPPQEPLDDRLTENDFDSGDRPRDTDDDWQRDREPREDW